MRPALRLSAALALALAAACGSSAPAPANGFLATNTDGGTLPQGGGTDAGNATDGGTATDGGSATDGGAATDGGTAAVCPPGYVPADASLTVVATPSASCAGLVPTAPTCMATIEACTGRHESPIDGVFGNVSYHATTDWDGRLALFCGNARISSGPNPGYAYWTPNNGGSGFSKDGHLGEEVWPLEAGFIGLSTSYNGTPAPTYDFFDGAGARRGSVLQGDSAMVSSPLTHITVGSGATTAEGTAIVARSYAANGSLLGELALGFKSGSATTYGGEVDVSGSALILYRKGTSDTQARWLGAGGRPLSASFSLAGAIATLALPGGGLALARLVDNGIEWFGVVRPGSTAVQPAPSWISGLDGQALGFVRGARGLAVITTSAPTTVKIAIVAGDGTSCGTVEGTGQHISLGADGTIAISDSGKLYRVYPQLLR